jgi:hypothetical protein
MSFADGSTLVMELGGRPPGSGGYDQVQSCGTLTLGARWGNFSSHNR